MAKAIAIEVTSMACSIPLMIVYFLCCLSLICSCLSIVLFIDIGFLLVFVLDGIVQEELVHMHQCSAFT